MLPLRQLDVDERDEEASRESVRAVYLIVTKRCVSHAVCVIEKVTASDGSHWWPALECLLVAAGSRYPWYCLPSFHVCGRVLACATCRLVTWLTHSRYHSPSTVQLSSRAGARFKFYVLSSRCATVTDQF